MPGLNDSKLARLVDPLLKEHSGQSGFIPITTGEDALAARIDLIRASEHSLDLQYYIWKDDLTGLTMIDAVRKAAERGVRVRLLLDNLNENKLQKDFKLFSMRPGIEVRVMNPSFKFINHRMHNKSFITDNKIAVVGGRNIGDEYFGGSKETNFTDFDIMLMGPVVNQISQEFDLYWNSDRSFPIEDVIQDEITKADRDKVQKRIEKYYKELRKSASYVKAINETELNLNAYWGNAVAMYDDPSKLTGKSKNNLFLKVRSVFKDVEQELILISPYFIPGKEGTKKLTNLRKKGVRIIVLTNSLASNDVSSVFGGYRRYREKLLENGIEIYEVKPEGTFLRKKDMFHTSSAMGLHGKVIISDRKRMFVGSMNLDSRSKNLNTEMGVILYNEILAELSADNLLKALPSISYKLILDNHQIEWLELKKEKIKTYVVDPKTTWWQRSKTWFFSLFIPEKFL